MISVSDVDPRIVPFYRNALVDLTVTNAAQADGKYLVFGEKPAADTTVIVKAFVPYAMQRTGVIGGGAGSEGLALIAPAIGAGFFQFEARTGSKSVASSQSFQDAFTDAASAVSSDKKTTGAVTHISNNPFIDALVIASGDSPLTYVGDSSAPLQVLFSLTPDANAGPLDRRFEIVTVGNAATPGLQRVDYAGVVLVGHQMPTTVYHELRNKLIGK